MYKAHPCCNSHRLGAKFYKLKNACTCTKNVFVDNKYCSKFFPPKLRLSIFASSFVVLILTYSADAVAQGWFPYDDVCRWLKNDANVDIDCSEPLMLTADSWIPDWAGEATRVYIDDTGTLRRYEVKITWLTNLSAFTCGAYVNFDVGEVKEFTHRSLAMARCN